MKIYSVVYFFCSGLLGEFTQFNDDSGCALFRSGHVWCTMHHIMGMIFNTKYTQEINDDGDDYYDYRLKRSYYAFLSFLCFFTVFFQ